MANRYTKSWQNTFLRPDSPAAPQNDKTEVQVGFLMGQLPLPEYRRVIDVCCGLGRHTIRLADAGYQMVGVDRDPDLISEAAAKGSEARFVQLDMRDLSKLNEQFDAVICMWQSFGYFDDEGNRAALVSMAGRLRRGGRLILDLYNREFFEASAPSSHRDQRGSGRGWTEHSLYRKRSRRLNVRIEWESGERDDFDWRLYSQDEIAEIGRRFGLIPALICSDFDPGKVPGHDQRSFQVVLEKR